MKVSIFLKLVALVLTFSCAVKLAAQGSMSVQRTYYKNALVDFYGLKFEMYECVAGGLFFKCVMAITNTTDNFVVIDLEDLFATGSKEKHRNNDNRLVVISPQNSRKFTVDIAGRDFRDTILFELKKVKMTGRGEVIKGPTAISTVKNGELYDLGKVGFRFVKLKKDNNTGHTIALAQTYYKAEEDKFLGYSYNNIVLKNSNGKEYYNAHKRTGDLYYNFWNTQEDNIFTFPVKFNEIDKRGSTLSLDNVFKEYTLETIEGPKYALYAGTENDFNASDKGDKKIDNIEDVDGGE